MIIRHAEPDYSIDSLTPKGRTEAELLATRIAGVQDMIGCFLSPKGRALDTAAYTLNRTGWHAEVLPWLQEFRGRCPDPDTGKVRNCWDFRPRSYAAHPLLADPDRFLEDPMFDGTNVADIWHETTEGVDEMLGRYGYRRDGQVWQCTENRHGTLVLFCHFAIGMAVYGYISHISPVLLWQKCCMAPSSVTTLVTEERVPGEVAFRCVQLGDISHLYAGNEPYSTAGLFPEFYDGIDNTSPRSYGSQA